MLKNVKNKCIKIIHQDYGMFEYKKINKLIIKNNIIINGDLNISIVEGIPPRIITILPV